MVKIVVRTDEPFTVAPITLQSFNLRCCALHCLSPLLSVPVTYIQYTPQGSSLGEKSTLQAKKKGPQGTLLAYYVLLCLPLPYQ